MIWFTADHHYGHANIIKHCSRPFASVHEMNETMTQRWNERVATTDTVYHVGDFAFRGQKADTYLRPLKGRKHLILGNHDDRKNLGDTWESISDILQVSISGTPIVLCHYGMRVWNRSHHGALHFYGHSHGKLPGTSQSLDVGVDCWDFRPVGLSEIQDRLGAVR